jgi:hypothetical protein
MSTMNSYIRIVATLFPRDMVCLRNISVDTLHKGDTEYDDDDNDNNTFYNIFKKTFDNNNNNNNNNVL